MASTAGNPYAAPKTRVSDAAPRFGVVTRAARALAFLGNAFLLLLPLVLYFSSRRSDTGFTPPFASVAPIMPRSFALTPTEHSRV